MIKDKENEINHLMFENMSKKIHEMNFQNLSFYIDYIDANNSLSVMSKKIKCKNGKVLKKHASKICMFFRSN